WLVSYHTKCRRLETNLNVLQVMILLIVAKGDIGAGVRGNSGLEVFEGLQGVLVAVVRAGELEPHIGFEEVLVPADAFDEEDAELGFALPDALDNVLPPLKSAVGSVQNTDSTPLVQEV